MADNSRKDHALAVVVIGRNEGERLARCLRSVTPLLADYPTAEIIYVDSASVDQSCSIAAELGARVVPIAPERLCAAAARNAGWRAASASIVFFLDGDTVLAPDFVGRALARFDDSSVAVVFGNTRELAPRQSLYTRVLDLDWIQPPGPTPICGGIALMRRDVLQRLGGFDEYLIAGEEPELCWRIRALGYRIEHLDLPMVGHDLAITRGGQYWRRAVRSGYAYAAVSARFRDTAEPLWLKPARRNLLHASLLILMLLGVVACALLDRSLLPPLLVVFVLTALAARSAWRARWRSSELSTLLLYGLHSHLGQIPIFIGQLKWRLDRRRGRTARLIEYKSAGGPPEARRENQSGGAAAATGS